MSLKYKIFRREWRYEEDRFYQVFNSFALNAIQKSKIVFSLKYKKKPSKMQKKLLPCKQIVPFMSYIYLLCLRNVIRVREEWNKVKIIEYCLFIKCKKNKTKNEKRARECWYQYIFNISFYGCIFSTVVTFYKQLVVPCHSLLWLGMVI